MATPRRPQRQAKRATVKSTTAQSKRQRVTVKPTTAPSKRPVASRRTVATEAVALERRVTAERAKRYADFQKQLKTITKATVRRAAPTLPILLAEGDSWFDYPWILGTRGSVIDHLQQLYAEKGLNVPILNMAHHGDDVRQILGLSQRQEIEKRLSDPKIHYDALLFSGGGNDLVGDQFCLWLRPFTTGATPTSLIDLGRFDAILQFVEAGYRDLVEIRNRLSPTTKIFVHGYDYPPPNGKGVCGVGPWLRPSLTYRGIVDKALQQDVMKEILQRFRAVLKQVEATSTDLFYVETQGTLQPQEWHNEIHPDRKGFTKVARQFQAALAAQFPQLA